MPDLASRKKTNEEDDKTDTESSRMFMEPMSGEAMCEIIAPDLSEVSLSKEEDIKKEAANIPSLSIEHLPDIVLGKIISYLHWKEKEWLLLAVPSLERILNSPLAWENFDNDRIYAFVKLHMYICFSYLMEHELGVIKKYGRFFQSCTIWIHKVTTHERENGGDLCLLKAVSHYCHTLKNVCIMHTSDISVPTLKICAHTYIRPLQELALNSGTGFRMSLNRLFYTSIETVQTGIFNYLNYLQDKGLLACLSCLDFSHGLILDPSSSDTIVHLFQCIYLNTLKCPLQSLTSSVIIYLANKNLNELYVVNDDHTQQMCFAETVLDWSKIYHGLPFDKKNTFNVHYIFKNRTVCNKDIFPNPLLRSLIFDNLSSNISSSLLHHIANSYGQTIQNLAFCSTYWEFLMHFADLGKINESFKYMARKCVKMTSFLSCLSIPSSALVCLALNSPRISTVLVYKENIRLAVPDKPEEIFLQKMAKALGCPNWDMVRKGNNIYVIPNVNCKLLFAGCFNEF